MQTSQNGINLIKGFESCRLHAYLDANKVGVPTIGYGHTHGVQMGMTITQAQAESFLKADLVQRESVVNSNVSVPLTQNQFDALMSLVYNVGAGNFIGHTLLRKLNAGLYEDAADEFPKWDHASGVVLKDLLERRNKERSLFLTPDA